LPSTATNPRICRRNDRRNDTSNINPTTFPASPTPPDKHIHRNTGDRTITITLLKTAAAEPIFDTTIITNKNIQGRLRPYIKYRLHSFLKIKNRPHALSFPLLDKSAQYTTGFIFRHPLINTIAPKIFYNTFKIEIQITNRDLFNSPTNPQKQRNLQNIVGHS